MRGFQAASYVQRVYIEHKVDLRIMKRLILMQKKLI